MELQEILTRWDSGDGKPYKGTLIDWAAYGGEGSEPPTDLGCMCAQGQVLHLLGGWTPMRIKNITAQSVADKEVAALLNISRGHAVLLRNVNDSVDGAPSIVLTDPGKVIGGEWSKLLDFWWHLDQMTAKQWADAGAAAWAAARADAWDAARAAAWADAGAAAWAAARADAVAAAGAAAWAAARAAAGADAGAAARAAARADAGAAAGAAAWDAAGEIQGAHIFAAAKRPFYFLPLFGFQTPAEIPARPANYGTPA